MLSRCQMTNCCAPRTKFITKAWSSQWRTTISHPLQTKSTRKPTIISNFVCKLVYSIIICITICLNHLEKSIEKSNALISKNKYDSLTVFPIVHGHPNETGCPCAITDGKVHSYFGINKISFLLLLLLQTQFTHAIKNQFCMQPEFAIHTSAKLIQILSIREKGE